MEFDTFDGRKEWIKHNGDGLIEIYKFFVTHLFRCEIKTSDRVTIRCSTLLSCHEISLTGYKINI